MVEAAVRRDSRGTRDSMGMGSVTCQSGWIAYLQRIYAVFSRLFRLVAMRTRQARIAPGARSAHAIRVLDPVADPACYRLRCVQGKYQRSALPGSSAIWYTS